MKIKKLYEFYWFHSFISAEMNTNYTLEQATTDVNNCLNNGSCLIQGLEDEEGEIPMYE